MKRQTLNFGSALLATTALSAAASAGTIVNLTADGSNAATTLTAASLSAQVFGGTATAQSAVTLGPTAVTLNFANSYTTKFDVEVESTNSNFTGATKVGVFNQAGGVATSSVSPVGSSGCTVQVLTERILIEDCLVSSHSAIDALSVSTIGFTGASALATAGTSIALSGIVRGQSNNTFELLTSANAVTSANSVKVTGLSNVTAATIRNASTPPFSDLTGGATAFSMGVVQITATGAVSTDLSTAIVTGDNLSGTLELTVTAGVLGDAATTTIDLGGSAGAAALAASVRASNFNGNVASFNVDGANATVGSYDIEVNFDGTTAISTWAGGTVDVVFSAGAQNLSGPPSASVALAGLTRDGFSTQINTAQSSAGNGATLFQSFVRVVNNGSVAGAVSIVVRDDTDGSSYGTYTSATIGANSTLQISMPTIETALSITAAGQYQLAISGPIDGYAQHVMFNSVDNHFIDLSSFRAANP